MHTPESEAAPLIEVRDLKVHFPITSGIFRRQTGVVQAVHKVSFDIRNGETLGLVGESGCGKSTTGRAILRLVDITDGSIAFAGVDIPKADKRQMKHLRPQMQMIFQDPQASLNPRMTVAEIIAEPLIEQGQKTRRERLQRVYELMDSVGLNRDWAARYPHEFSGGQRQRIGIARALALNPRLVICDEPIAALDVSIQAQVVNLLERLQVSHQLTYLFISHDLGMVRHIADRVAVMYLGRIMEMGPKDDLYSNPLHPYTEALLSALPQPDPGLERKRRRILLKGDVASPADPPSGCVFRTRCPKAIDLCRERTPKFAQIAPGRFAACHLLDISGDENKTIPGNSLTGSKGEITK
ncbi:MAG: ATP-binding cassette domain-containing protein [Rhodobacteraceae bacterium]|nr:ATP-binding cassette domain-containing protein [Paracoccaceae bacterium]